MVKKKFKKLFKIIISPNKQHKITMKIKVKNKMINNKKRNLFIVMIVVKNITIVIVMNMQLMKIMYINIILLKKKIIKIFQIKLKKIKIKEKVQKQILK